jgi:hypothetical protein
VHQVDLGLELRCAAEPLERRAFILENLDVNLLKEIGDYFIRGRAVDAEPPIGLINAVRQAWIESPDELLPISIIIIK